MKIKTSDLTIFGIDDVLGQVGGNSHTQIGGGVNYLCLPSDPENGYPQSYENGQVFGAEYEIFYNRKPAGMSPLLGDTEVPCAVCHRKQRSSVLMIPGKSNKNTLSLYLFVLRVLGSRLSLLCQMMSLCTI